jgi:penicillin amidase
MKLTTSAMLERLGAGDSIDAVCQAAGLSAEEFQQWWRKETLSRVPPASGVVVAETGHEVRIERDERGIPHISAENDDDLFFGFGYSAAQDRLFQLDYLRRRGRGRLAEVLGRSGFELDLIARTAGLSAIAAKEWEQLPEETRRLVEAYTRGVNAVIGNPDLPLPVEFDLLGYRPEAWQPQDCLVIACEFRWYLTVRFPIILIPELAKRTLDSETLYRAALTPEADDESILPREFYPAGRRGVEQVGATVGDPQEGLGSNNWVIAGARTETGHPLVASDPHIAFAAVSCWHEVHLTGGSFDVAGMTHIGMPAVMFGRNRKVAWGCTNNICSQRDLYQEQTSPEHPGCFLFDGEWEPAGERTEVINIRGEEPVHKVIHSSRNGPIVNEILPPVAQGLEPISLRWLGFEACGWLTALLAMDRATTATAFREATRPWLVPTFSVVYADVDGNIGYQSTGRIPVREVWERGCRPGWDPQHQWQGQIPFEAMPAAVNPERGWLATANNRVATSDFPYPLSGVWSSGHRARRVRQMLEALPQATVTDCIRMQQDTRSSRAVDCTPRLIRVLRSSDSPRVRLALEFLEAWDCRMEPDRVGATLFNVFFTNWCQHVADQRFSQETSAFIAPSLGGLATTLLESDPAGWFYSDSSREEAIVRVFENSLSLLEKELGADPLGWSWGRKHILRQQHFLSGRGDLGQLLDRGGMAVRGDGMTVCNTGADPNWGANMGAGYRLVADLSDPNLGMWAVDAGAQSGQPGSLHYDDQLVDWMTGAYHYLPLVGKGSGGRECLILRPTTRPESGESGPGGRA